jgi:hypothetical protein
MGIFLVGCVKGFNILRRKVSELVTEETFLKDLKASALVSAVDSKSLGWRTMTFRQNPLGFFIIVPIVPG